MRRRPHRWAPWALALVLSSALEITLSEESTLSESSIISEKSPPGDVPTSTSKSSQFSGKWYAGPNASLAFEFRSLHANGLLLYADDAIGHGFFVEAKLVDGRVTLRYRLPTGSSTGSGDRSLTSQQKRGSQQGITSSATIASRITFGRFATLMSHRCCRHVSNLEVNRILHLHRAEIRQLEKTNDKLDTSYTTFCLPYIQAVFLLSFHSNLIS